MLLYSEIIEQNVMLSTRPHDCLSLLSFLCDINIYVLQLDCYCACGRLKHPNKHIE